MAAGKHIFINRAALMARKCQALDARENKPRVRNSAAWGGYVQLSRWANLPEALGVGPFQRGAHVAEAFMNALRDLLRAADDRARPWIGVNAA